MDSDRVRAAKEAIANGTLQVDADSIARKLANMEKDLPDLG